MRGQLRKCLDGVSNRCRWGTALSFLAVLLTQSICAADPPPGVPPLPFEIVERDEAKRELRDTLPKKYRLESIEIEGLQNGVGIDIRLFGDITPEAERGRPFTDPQDRVRRMARAFRAENSKILPREGSGLEIVESGVDTTMGPAHINYTIRIGGTELYDAWAHFVARETGQLIIMDARYPIIAPDTIEKIKAALDRAMLSKEQVLGFIEADRRRTRPGASIRGASEVFRYVFPTPPYVRWLMGVSFEGEDPRGMGYEVDGETGAVLRRMSAGAETEEMPPFPTIPLPPPGSVRPSPAR